MLAAPTIHGSRRFASFPQLMVYTRAVRERREKTLRPKSSTPSADIKEDLAKAIDEFTRDIDSLELTRDEDHATFRELEIGVLKSPFIGSNGNREFVAYVSLYFFFL